jgi:uncharacterized protein YodC (DUF2158 family)
MTNESAMRREIFKSAELFLVTTPAPNDPPLSFGEMVRLNSGGPSGLVVDIENADELVVAWGDTESVIHRNCLARCERPRRSTL